MARMVIAEDEIKKRNLDELIPEFGKTNDVLKDLKKEIAILNTYIKDLMKDSDHVYVAGDYKAKYTEVTKESLDEELFLSHLGTAECPAPLRHEAEMLGLIKTKEVIDMDALEKALYKEAVSDFMLEDLRACTTTTVTPKLTVTKLKEKK